MRSRSRRRAAIPMRRRSGARSGTRASECISGAPWGSQSRDWSQARWARSGCCTVGRKGSGRSARPAPSTWSWRRSRVSAAPRRGAASASPRRWCASCKGTWTLRPKGPPRRRGFEPGRRSWCARTPSRAPRPSTGTVCARGDSLRIAVGTQVGRQATDPTVITAQGETGHLERVADTLAYGLVRNIWNRENPLDLVLPRTALPQTAAGLAAWLAAERLLAQGRWGDADRAYEEAERIDSTCWLCAWRHADVDRCLGRKFDEARAARYLGHIDSFPPHYRRLMRASRRPLLERLEMLISLTHERRDFLPAQFMLADEVYHRGPLVGHPRREAIEAFQRVLR